MFKWLLINRRLHDLVRCSVYVSLATILLLSVGMSAQMVTRGLKQEDPVSIEHRFSVLETKVDMIIADNEYRKIVETLTGIGMAGLLGETGLRAYRERGKR